MTKEPFQVLGSAECSFIVVNQVKEHYLAAGQLLAGSIDRPGFRFWILGQVLDACAQAIENAIDRLAIKNGITRRKEEKMPSFRIRIPQEAGLHLGARAHDHMKTLVDHWNAHKHSGDEQMWKKWANLRTRPFTTDTFHLTTAFLGGSYRVVNPPEEPEWLRRVEVQRREIVVLPLATADLDQLLAEWEITAKS